MDLSALTDLVAGLGTGVAGVAFVVIGLPIVLAMLPGLIARARRSRRWQGVGIALLVGAVLGVAGAFLWSQALTSHPGAFDQALMMLALTLLPFTATAALIALFAGWSGGLAAAGAPAPAAGLAASTIR